MKKSVTFYIIALNVLIFVGMALQSMSFLHFDSAMLLKAGGATTTSSPITYLSANFVHGGLIHLIFNMQALSSIGESIENRLGKRLYAMIYLFSGILIFGISMQLYALNHLNIVCIGASGVIMMLLGMWLVMLSHYYITNRVHNSEILKVFKGTIINLGLISLLSLIPGVSGLTHLVGFLIGVLMMIAIVIWKPKQQYFA